MNGVVYPTMKETIIKYQKLIDEPFLRNVWVKTMYKELGCLAQGYKDVKGTDTIRFIERDEITTILTDRTVTYAQIVVYYREQKVYSNCVRLTVGGNLIEYPYELTTRTVDVTNSKVMWNSVISTNGVQYACADMKNFYLNTPLGHFEYM